MEQLKEMVSQKATEYWNETASTGQEVKKMLNSIVDFVVEYFFNCSNFPSGYTEDKKVALMKKYVNAMAMGCVDVYAKAGAEGQLSHNENSTSRTYKSAWISPELLRDLPNFVNVLG